MTRSPRLKISVSTLILLFSTAALRASEEELPVRPLDGFVDSYNAVLHAGFEGAVVGATTVDDAGENFLRPAVYLPAPLASSGQPVCIEATSIDGVYGASGTISGDDLRNSAGRLRFLFADSKNGASKYQHELRGMDPEQLAILARLGDCHSRHTIDTSRVVVVDRSGGLANSGIRLYVNSGMASAARVAYLDTLNHWATVACRSPSGHANTKTFNLICELPPPVAPVTKIKLIPVRYGQPLDSLEYELLYAGPGFTAATGPRR